MDNLSTEPLDNLAAQIAALRQQGRSLNVIARELDLPAGTIREIAKRYKIEQRVRPKQPYTVLEVIENVRKAGHVLAADRLATWYHQRQQALATAPRRPFGRKRRAPIDTPGVL